MTNEHLYIVVNAGCREKDLAHVGKHLAAFKARRWRGRNSSQPPPLTLEQAEGKHVDLHVHDERALLALQGPKAVTALKVLTPRVLQARLTRTPAAV